jgi:eukaryotic-like serine/threonine-protein kinase
MGAVPTGAGALVGQRLGKYELVALLALGGTAEIYLARIDGTAGFEKYVVVKCLHDHLADDAEFVSMFLDEARLGAQLDHSNIVQTLALGEHQGRYYLVMEYIAGLSLALVGRRAHERVRGGKVPVPIVLNIAAQACGGLHYAHTRTDAGHPLNLVHRDISPQNLVITHEGIVKLVDFGIAKADRRQTRTRGGTVKGKFAYMSPEQCLAGDVDHRTDVFALGVIVWELLTGRRLFKRESTYETYQAVAACEVPPPSSVHHELDPALDAIVMSALTRDRAARYPSAEAFGEALIGYLHHRGKPSGPGEIARFFDDCFAQERDDHFARMRELIEGRARSVADRLLQWDASELDGSASVLEPDDVDAVLEASDSAPRPDLIAHAARVGVAVGPVSPPLARAVTAPERPGALDTVPVRRVALPEVAAEDDFEAGQTTDAEYPQGGDDELVGDATRIDANPLDAIAAVAEPPSSAPPPRATTGPERRRDAPARQVITPAGLRAGGAPLDPLPHEREAMLAMAPPPPTAVSAPPASRFSDAPTVIAGQTAPPPGTRFPNAPTVIAATATPAVGSRFSDAATVHDARTAAPRGKPRFADAETVHAAPALPPLGTEPPTGQTQLLSADDLMDVTPGARPVDTSPASPGPDAPTAPAVMPLPAHLIELPGVGDVFPDQPHLLQVAATEPRVWPAWLLAVMFVVVAAAATGITVAIARAVS